MSAPVRVVPRGASGADFATDHDDADRVAPKRRGRPPGSGVKGKPGPKPGAKRAIAAGAAATNFAADAQSRATLLWLVDQLRERGVLVSVTLTAEVR